MLVSPNQISIKSQLIQFLERNPNIFEKLEYGEIKLELRNKKIYRIIVSNSILVRENDEKEQG